MGEEAKTKKDKGFLLTLVRTGEKAGDCSLATNLLSVRFAVLCPAARRFSGRHISCTFCWAAAGGVVHTLSPLATRDVYSCLSVGYKVWWCKAGGVIHEFKHSMAMNMNMNVCAFTCGTAAL